MDALYFRELLMTNFDSFSQQLISWGNILGNVLSETYSLEYTLVALRLQDSNSLLNTFTFRPALGLLCELKVRSR